MKSPRTLAFIAAVTAASFIASASAAGGSDTARVWVQFQPGAAAQVGAALQNAGGEVHHRFDDLNAYAVTLPARAINSLQRNPSVTLIEDDPRRYPMTQVVPYGIPMVQADQVSDANAGNRRVCVIDSGYDLGHEDLPAGGNVTGSADGGAGPWFEDGDGHGTHVTGTIAALNNAVGVLGVAPSELLNLHIVRVFNDSGSWAYSSGLVAALNECLDAGSNVVNMSLGGSFKSRNEEIAFNNAFNAGVLPVAAAGNAGNNRHSYPASYDGVVSVAAIDENKVVAPFSQQNNQVELSAPGVGVLSTFPMGQAVSGELTAGGDAYDNAAMDGSPHATGAGPLHDCGLGTSVCSGASGNVCLISRGEVTFAEKVQNCEAGGGVAAVIYNNESGMLFGTLGDASTGIPSVGTTQAIGQELSGRLGDSATVTVGPSNYAHLSGTSMATPHVAGVAAVIWSHYLGCTSADVRDAMTATAEDLGPAGRDNAYGYGLVQAKNALDHLAMQVCAGGDTGNGDNGDNGDEDPPTCAVAGTPCSSHAECCNNCTGPPSNRTCN